MRSNRFPIFSESIDTRFPAFGCATLQRIKQHEKSKHAFSINSNFVKWFSLAKKDSLGGLILRIPWGNEKRNTDEEHKQTSAAMRRTVIKNENFQWGESSVVPYRKNERNIRGQFGKHRRSRFRSHDSGTDHGFSVDPRQPCNTCSFIYRLSRSYSEWTRYNVKCEKLISSF